MTWELHLRHYNRNGVLLNGYIAPLAGRYTNSLDADEPLVFTLNADTYAVYEPIEEYHIIEVMIRNRLLGVQSADGGFVRDFVGIVRRSNPDRETNSDGVTMLTWYAPEQKHLLNWRRVLWPSGVANRSTFSNVPAETAVKTLVDYNCTANATTANGRWRNGNLNLMGVTLDIATDLASGDNVSLSFAGGGLLESLAKVCELGGDYYTIDWQGGSEGGAHEWAVTWGRGSDKSAGENRVLFALQNNTLSNPRRRYTQAHGTTAVSAGEGEGAARQVSFVDGADYVIDNDIELFVDARNAKSAAAREGQGALKLDELREQSLLEFDVIETGDVFYSPIAVTGRKTYKVGDRVLVSYGGDEIRRIRRTIASWDFRANSQPFQVEIETELWNS